MAEDSRRGSAGAGPVYPGTLGSFRVGNGSSGGCRDHFLGAGSSGIGSCLVFGMRECFLQHAVLPDVFVYFPAVYKMDQHRIKAPFELLFFLFGDRVVTHTRTRLILANGTRKGRCQEDVWKSDRERRGPRHLSLCHRVLGP